MNGLPAGSYTFCNFVYILLSSVENFAVHNERDISTVYCQPRCKHIIVQLKLSSATSSQTSFWPDSITTDSKIQVRLVVGQPGMRNWGRTINKPEMHRRRSRRYIIIFNYFIGPWFHSISIFFCLFFFYKAKC